MQARGLGGLGGRGVYIALYKDFFSPRLRFLFLFLFYFPSHALDFSHIFQLSTNQVPIKYRLINCQLIKRVRECVACIDSLYAVCARFVRQG